MRDAGIKEDAFGSRRLSGIDMGDDTDVAILLDGSRARHKVVRLI